MKTFRRGRCHSSIACTGAGTGGVNFILNSSTYRVASQRVDRSNSAGCREARPHRQLDGLVDEAVVAAEEEVGHGPVRKGANGGRSHHPLPFDVAKSDAVVKGL